MLTFDMDLQSFSPAAELSDPRGGRVIDASSSLRFNNLHVPCRGGDFQSIPVAPDGQPSGYHWMLPYAEDTATDQATIRALDALRQKATQPKSGYTGQVFYSGMSFGVTSDG